MFLVVLNSPDRNPKNHFFFSQDSIAQLHALFVNPLPIPRVHNFQILPKELPGMPPDGTVESVIGLEPGILAPLGSPSIQVGFETNDVSVHHFLLPQWCFHIKMVFLSKHFFAVFQQDMIDMFNASFIPRLSLIDILSCIMGLILSNTQLSYPFVDIILVLLSGC